jgi:hypothetical protein
MGDGERGRNRTFNLLIKSQLLCQLSYAPTVGFWLVGTNKNYSIWRQIFCDAKPILVEKLRSAKRVRARLP